MRRRQVILFFRQFRQFDIKLVQMIQFLFGQVLDIHHPVTGALVRGQQLIQL